MTTSTRTQVSNEPTHNVGTCGCMSCATARHALTAELLAALKAAAQFLSPDVDRGPGVNGWENTVALVDAAIANAEGA